MIVEVIDHEVHHILKKDGVAVTYSHDEPDTVRVGIISQGVLLDLHPSRAIALLCLLEAWNTGACE